MAFVIFILSFFSTFQMNFEMIYVTCKWKPLNIKMTFIYGWYNSAIVWFYDYSIRLDCNKTVSFSKEEGVAVLSKYKSDIKDCFL